MSDTRVIDVILHCQKQIKKELLPEEKLLHYLGRLSRLRITVQDLAETGIGRTVNQLSRNEGAVGQAADTLVRSWKRMVSEQQQPEPEPESDDESDSNSNSGSSDDEEEDDVNNDDEPYEIDEQEENTSLEYRNGHPSADERQDLAEPPSSLNLSREYEDDDQETDIVDEIEDPYMENGFLNMANVHTDDEDEEEEEDDDDEDSDTSDRLQIADEEHPYRNEMKHDIYLRHEKEQVNHGHPSHTPEESRDHRNSQSKSSNHKLQENGDNRHIASSSSKSHRHQHRSEKSHSSSSSNSKESSKDHKHHSSSKSHHGESKDRSSKHSDQASDHKSHHHSSSSRSEKSKEFKSETTSSDKNYHKERDRHKHSEKHSRESSSHREKEKDGKSDKERSKDKKDGSDYHRSSSSHHQKDKSRDASSSSHSLKKSSPDIKKPELLEERKRKETSESSGSSSSKKQKLVPKDEEIDSTSGVNFEDVLGSLNVPSSKHKKAKRDSETLHRKHESHSHGSSFHSHHKSDSSKKYESPPSSKHSREGSGSSSSKKVERDSEATKMIKKPAHSKIESVIKPVVNISPHYKPMSSTHAPIPRPGSSNGGVAAPPIQLSQADFSDLGTVDCWDNAGTKPSDDDISSMLSSRSARSKVYSGVKAGRRGAVPSLFDLCMQVIKDNIGDLGYTGGIPYDILKPALERANPLQLMCIEEQNDYLIGETDELWHFHCKRDFRGRGPDDMESWRELYERCKEEEQVKFEKIKKKMKKTIESAEPVRKAKLAYVDTSHGPKFNKQKAQTIKNGMKTLKYKEEKGPKRGVSSSASAGFNNPKKSGEGNIVVEEAAIIIAPESRAGHAPAPSVSRESSSSAAAKLKPKKAPLMQKTMKLIRSLNRR